MNKLHKAHTPVGLALLLVTLSSAAIGEAPPRKFSEEAVDVIPDIEQTFSCYGLDDRGYYGPRTPQVSCSEGLTKKVFTTNSRIESYPVCNGKGSWEGISCDWEEGDTWEEDGTISWTLATTIPDGDDVSPPSPPAAINSVILEHCQQSYGPDRADRAEVATYTHVYGPFGATRDAGLTMFVRDYYEGFDSAQPQFVTFCYDDADNPRPVTTAVIPICQADSGVCAAGNTDETYLVEVSRLRGNKGEVLQPQASLDEDTCVCNPVDDEPLTQFDPAAIREPDEGPGQVTRMDQWNGDPYFCTTLNGRRYCWAY